MQQMQIELTRNQTGFHKKPLKQVCKKTFKGIQITKNGASLYKMEAINEKDKVQTNEIDSNTNAPHAPGSTTNIDTQGTPSKRYLKEGSTFNITLSYSEKVNLTASTMIKSVQYLKDFKKIGKQMVYDEDQDTNKKHKEQCNHDNEDEIDSTSRQLHTPNSNVIIHNKKQKISKAPPPPPTPPNKPEELP